MFGVLPAMLAEFAHFNFPFNKFLILTGIIIDHFAGLTAKLY